MTEHYYKNQLIEWITNDSLQNNKSEVMALISKVERSEDMFY